MPDNIEIKAKLNDVERALLIAEDMSDQAVRRISQHDTFFRASSGRLKLREFSDGTGELIYYLREDSPGPSRSNYQITTTEDPAGLRRLLSAALGVSGEVVKTRCLYMKGRTRIHIDSVQGLGDFLELEVVLAKGEEPSAGIKEAQEIMAELSIRDEQLVHCAYIDLIGGKN